MTYSISYAVSSLLYTLAGLAAGYWLGRAGRLEASMSTPSPSTAATPPRHPMTRSHRIGAAVVGLVLVVLAVASVATGVAYIGQQQDDAQRQGALIACVNEYNAANRARSVALVDTSARERNGLKTLVVAAFADPQNIETTRAALRQYLDVTAQADAQRAAYPLPDQDC